MNPSAAPPPPPPAPLAGDRSVTGAVAMLHVRDVEASARFYQLLGLERQNQVTLPDGTPVWQWMGRRGANVMLSRASGPIDAANQAALLYLYAPDVHALRAHLLAAGLRDGGPFTGTGPLTTSTVFAVTHPHHMPGGELRIHDPDGWCLLVGSTRQPIGAWPE